MNQPPSDVPQTYASARASYGRGNIRIRIRICILSSTLPLFQSPAPELATPPSTEKKKGWWWGEQRSYAHTRVPLTHAREGGRKMERQGGGEGDLMNYIHNDWLRAHTL